MAAFLQGLGIDPMVFVAQFVSFAVLVVVLRVYLYHPIEDILRQRSEQIANSLSSAETHKAQAESLRKEYEVRLASIADEARARLEQAVKDGEMARQRLLENTQAEIRELHARSDAQLALDRDQLRRELRSEMADISVMAASRALRGQMTQAIQAKVIDQVMTELDRPN